MRYLGDRTARWSCSRGIAAIITGAALGWTAIGAPAAPSGAASRGATQPETLPSPDALLDRHLDAIGGIDALRAHTNRVIEGRLRSSDGKHFVLTTVWASEDDRLIRRVESPGELSFTEYFDGVHAWRERSDGQLSLIVGETLRDLAQDAEYHILADYRENLPTRRTIGAGELDGRATYIVEVVSRFGKTERLHFDQQSGLLVMIQTTTAGPEQRIPLSVRFEQYDEFESVRYSTTQSQRTSGGIIEVSFDRIRVNVDDFPEIVVPEPVRRAFADFERRRESSDQPPIPEPPDGPVPDPAAPPDVPPAPGG